MTKYNLTTLTEPEIEPVTLDELKVHLVLEHGEQDTLLPDMITAARVAVEEYTGLSVALRTMRFSSEVVPSVIRLPRTPIVSIDAYGYEDGDGATQTVDPADITINSSILPERITTIDGLPAGNSVVVDYTVGYDFCDTPAGIRRAILIHCGWQFGQRGDNEKLLELPAAFYHVCDQYSVGEEFQVYP